MSGFLYYIPAASRPITRETLDRAGIAYAFDRLPTPRGVRGGPDGGEGLVVADDRRVSEIGYFADRQTWRPLPGSTTWVGWETAAAIGPEEGPELFAREKLLGGHPVRLLDGHDWLVPIARAHTEEDGELRWYVALPQRATLDAEGHWRRDQVVPRYRALWDLAVTWHDAQRGAAIEVGEEGEGDQGNRCRRIVTFDGLLDAAVQALAGNYAVGPVEVDALGLLTEELAVEVLDALIDAPTAMQWVKKKLAAASAGASTGDGPADSTVATGPA